MKKLLFLSDESVLSGYAKTGIAEVVDSLANVMTSNYEVSVVCPDGNSIFIRATSGLKNYKEGVRTCKLLNVTYYLINIQKWPDTAIDMVNELKPDILHNFAAPELLSLLDERPQRCIFTIDQADFVKDKPNTLLNYDAITTVSENYATELLNREDELSKILIKSNFKGITNGILDTVFDAEKGLFLPESYGADNQIGKEVCKNNILKTYGIAGNPCIYLMMCRLVQDKGLDEVIDSIHHIQESGGFVIFVGKGDSIYEDKLRTLTHKDGALWLDKRPSPMQVIPLLAGADFYLSPSIVEACGLMPMTACRYGTIPIVTLNGGLKDNMSEDIAIIVDEDGMVKAIDEAVKLYKDKNRLEMKRSLCMKKDFSWENRKNGYIKIYEEI